MPKIVKCYVGSATEENQENEQTKHGEAVEDWVPDYLLEKDCTVVIIVLFCSRNNTIVAELSLMEGNATLIEQSNKMEK